MKYKTIYIPHEENIVKRQMMKFPDGHSIAKAIETAMNETDLVGYEYYDYIDLKIPTYTIYGGLILIFKSPE